MKAFAKFLCVLSLTAFGVACGGESGGAAPPPPLHQSPSGVADDQPVSQAAAGPATILLHPARLLDVRTGTFRDYVVVSVTGDRIVSIDDASAAASIQVIELPGLTLLPGLMDVHTHLTYDVEDDYTNQAVKENLADLALRGARNARRTLMAG